MAVPLSDALLYVALVSQFQSAPASGLAIPQKLSGGSKTSRFPPEPSCQYGKTVPGPKSLLLARAGASTRSRAGGEASGAGGPHL